MDFIKAVMCEPSQHECDNKAAFNHEGMLADHSCSRLFVKLSEMSQSVTFVPIKQKLDDLHKTKV